MFYNEMKARIAEFNFTVFAEGSCRDNGSPEDGCDFAVFGNDLLACIVRDQSGHSGKYFVIDVLYTPEAFEKADRLFGTHLAERRAKAQY